MIHISFFRWNELIVAGLFVSDVTLWITRDITIGAGGWSRFLTKKYKIN